MKQKQTRKWPSQHPSSNKKSHKPQSKDVEEFLVKNLKKLLENNSSSRKILSSICHFSEKKGIKKLWALRDPNSPSSSATLKYAINIILTRIKDILVVSFDLLLKINNSYFSRHELQTSIHTILIIKAIFYHCSI